MTWPVLGSCLVTRTLGIAWAVPCLLTIRRTAAQSHTRSKFILRTQSTYMGACVMFNNCFLCEQREEAFQYPTAHCLYFLNNFSRAAFHLFLKCVCICVRYCSDALWTCVAMTSAGPSRPVTRAGLPGNHSAFRTGENGKSSPVAI